VHADQVAGHLVADHHGGDAVTAVEGDQGLVNGSPTGVTDTIAGRREVPSTIRQSS
jgi:hypothetical protein